MPKHPPGLHFEPPATADELHTTAPPKDREVEAQKKRELNAKRFGR